VKSLADAAAIWISAQGETETVTTGPQIHLGDTPQQEAAKAKGAK
jgi:hypothetical protein